MSFQNGCDIDAECKNEICVFTVSNISDNNEDALKRDIDRFQMSVEKTKIEKGDLEYNYKTILQICPELDEYPDNARQRIGNILLTAMKEIHEIIGPVADKPFEIFTDNYYVYGVRGTSISKGRAVIFRDAWITLFNSIEDAYEEFIEIADPKRICKFERWE